ncbi:LbetaH domain-containing protein [Alkaliphilus hydrothermalis]|uniref:Carbon dioxide concentrating mechanism protein CcmM n=1 Tax=Alkaliphilus hydrothermalis TaxID=1482730 RepID=A0ABS2NPY3_9FIRM|nr:carbonate dehydratase [Alkaliphilus hydrothermalis]MBM7614931.1 carbon dioxide concentrating mechanism protein CcmM [Alkaliphilus hydrothermalis]
MNVNAVFIGSNPVTSFIPYSYFPQIHPSVYIGPFTSIIGAVFIRENVFIAPSTTIRADEGYPFYIGRNTNIQDGVIFHGLKGQRISVKDRLYSIYVGDRVSCAHGCTIHGPCFIGNNCFIGFNAIVFDAILEEGVYVSANAVVTGGVTVAKNKFVPPGASIDSQEKADALSIAPADKEAFVEEVQRVNSEFPPSYSLLFGKNRCSCGLACDRPVSCTSNHRA